MPEMNFGDFLDKMSGKKNYKQPQSVKKPRRIVEEEEKEEEEPKQKAQKPKQNTEKPKKEKEEEIMAKDKTSSDDDIVIKALDYSKRFIKVIYDNFKSPSDRRVVLQSIRTAIDLALGDNQARTVQQSQPRKTNTNINKEEEKQVQQASQDEGIEIHMNDLSGQEFNMTPQAPQSLDESEGYNRNLNLDLRVNADGKREADLSRVSQKEMNEMRILAGIEQSQE